MAARAHKKRVVVCQPAPVPVREQACSQCHGPVDDGGACVNPAFDGCDRSELSVADRSPVPPPEEPETEEPAPKVTGLDDFEEGVIFAMNLLKDEINGRTDEADRLKGGSSRDVGTILNALSTSLTGLRVHFETRLMQGISDRRRAKREGKKP